MSGGLFTCCVLRACARYYDSPIISNNLAYTFNVYFEFIILNFEFILIFYITKFTSYHQASVTSWESHCERKFKMKKI